MTALVIEVGADSLRGILFARVEGKLRFVTDATSPRVASLSTAVDAIGDDIAAQTGLAAASIRRDPIFVLASVEDLASQTVRTIDRTQALASSCAALALARNERLTYVEANDGHQPGPLIDAEPGSWPRVKARTGEAQLSTGGYGDAVGLIVAGGVYATLPAGIAVMAVLDHMTMGEPDALTVAIDADRLMAAAGALDGEGLASVVQHDLLGASTRVVYVAGDGQPGRLAARGQVASVDGGAARFSVPWGSVHWIEGPSWVGGTVTIAGQDGATIAGKRFARLDIGPASHGAVLIDARGRLREGSASGQLSASWHQDAANPS